MAASRIKIEERHIIHTSNLAATEVLSATFALCKHPSTRLDLGVACISSPTLTKPPLLSGWMTNLQLLFTTIGL